MRISHTTLAAATAAALAALLAPAQAQAAAPDHAGETVTLSVEDAIAALPVRAEDRTGYKRSSFRHWIDADRDGCNTRQEVLLEEALVSPEQGTGCTISGGEWYSEYDATVTDNARSLDIDHRVPLAEAWDSGASSWTAADREAYANDLGDARSLVAVSARTNRSKGDQDPTTWMPPYAGDRCQYLAYWVVVKTRWQLAVDPAEQEALQENLAGCDVEPIQVTLAR